MSDLTDPNADLDASGLNPAERRILQDKANKAEQLEAELAAARQQLAVRDAGLTLNEAQLKALTASHEGDWSPDALKQTATDLGWVQPQPQGPPQADVQAMQRIDQATAGGAPIGAPPDSAQKLDEILKQVKTLGNQQLATALPAAMEAIREAGLNFDSVQYGGMERIAGWGATK